jgi:hypothetical protein
LRGVLQGRLRRDGTIVELTVVKSSVEGWQLRGVLQGRLRRDGAIVELTVVKSSVEGWQLSRALQGRLRRDGAIVELTVVKSSVEEYSPDSNDVSEEAEASPLLEAVARERMLKKCRLEKAYGAGICQVWKSAIAL